MYDTAANNAAGGTAEALMETDPRFGLFTGEGIFKEIAKTDQKITISTVARRYGKITTLVSGFDRSVDMKSIAKALKEKLACGGTVKGCVIELQGNHRKRLKPLLTKLGFSEDAISD